ncbi:hypothetical protein [Niallia sp. 01092]
MNIEREDVITDDFLNKVVSEINELYGWQSQLLEEVEKKENEVKEN